MRRWYMVLAAVLLALGVSGMQADAAEAATVDINGRVYEGAAEGVRVENGTTMISEDVLQEAFYLTLERDGADYTLRNAYGDFLLEGTVGETTLVMDQDRVFTLPVAAMEQDETLYLPLRAIAERFGYVNWYGDRDRTLARFDYNAQAQLEDVTVSEETVQGAFVPDASFSEPLGALAYDETSAGVFYTKLDDQGYGEAFGTLDEDLVRVQHEGYHFHFFTMDEDAFCWWESPLEGDTDTSYLYLQARQPGAEPQLIAQSDQVASRGGARALGNSYTALCGGNVLWAVASDAGDEIALWLYEGASGETTRLDSLPAEDGLGGAMQVALSEDEAVWVAVRHVKQNLRQYEGEWEASASYGDLKRYDLASGKTENLSQGYNLNGPSIVGRYLVASTALQEGAETIKNEVWVYDLEEERWQSRVPYEALGVEDIGNNLSHYADRITLDETHLALPVTGTETAYPLSVLDVENASVHRAVDAEGAPLCWAGIAEEPAEGQTILTALRPVNDLGTSLATVKSLHDGTRAYYHQPITWTW